MKTDITQHFAAIGAGVEITSINSRDRRIGRQWMSHREKSTPMLVDVDRQGREEHFTVTRFSDTEVRVADIDRSCRHLVLTAKAHEDRVTRTFLCGRDESHWFVAAIPEQTEVRTVQQAMNALKPEAVWESIRRHNLPESQWNLRHTAAFVRQGEWFFIPRPDKSDRGQKIRKREPLSRGFGSQFHWCQEVIRDGGELVYVNSKHPQGLTGTEVRRLPLREQAATWREMRRGASVLARGYVRHRDHATITLDGWHEVVMNTEGRASAMRHVTFLD
ncbi:MAG TPA: hypothetical protein VK968_14115 [Roseimicrobium sp.]|nr:hypothetical protein [Roseimicrobium sp.]